MGLIVPGQIGLSSSSGGVSYSSGVDAARPAASSGNLGSFYYATDVRVLYECIAGPKWRVVGAKGEEGFDTTGAMVGSTYSARMLGTASLSAAQTVCMALIFQGIGTPGAVNILASCGPNQFEWGNNNSDRYKLSVNLAGTGTARVEIGTISASPNTIHCLVTKTSGFNTVWSIDGGAAASASHVSGSASGSAALAFSAASFGSNAHIISCVTWSTALADADLAVVSGAYATGRIPGVTGATETMRWHAGHYTSGVLTQQYASAAVAGQLAWTNAFFVTQL